VLHGNRTYLLMDDDGQIQDAHSISAGLDYPGIGPEHSWLHDTGRVTYLSRPTTRRSPRSSCCRGSKASSRRWSPRMRIAKVMELAPKKPKDHLMVVNLSGRGDKDIGARRSGDSAASAGRPAISSISSRTRLHRFPPVRSRSESGLFPGISEWTSTSAWRGRCG
jgi:tryptophan synthase beta subunit